MLGALFGLAVDVEMQCYSGERREWKIDDDVAPKLHLKVCIDATSNCINMLIGSVYEGLFKEGTFWEIHLFTF